MWGVASTSGRCASRGEGIWSGARPTSRAAPARRPPSSAASSAASSTSSPRARLMKQAPGFMWPNRPASIRFAVSGVAAARHTAKSARASSPSKVSAATPSASMGACGSWARTRIPNACASTAMRRAMRPKPIRPSVASESCVPRRGTAPARPRARAIIMPMPSSATASVKPGVTRVTRTPCALAAAVSTVLMSTAQRRNASRSGAASNVAAVPGVARSAMTTWQPAAACASSASRSTRPVPLRTTSAWPCRTASTRSPKYRSNAASVWVRNTRTGV